MLSLHNLHPSLEAWIGSAFFKNSALPGKSWKEQFFPTAQCVHTCFVYTLSVWVREPACASEAQSRALGIRSLADGLTPLRQSSPDLKLALSARLPCQWPLGICLSLPPCARFADPHSHAWYFMWVLGIETQVLMLAERALLPTEPSAHPRPQNTILRSTWKLDKEHLLPPGVPLVSPGGSEQSS